MKQKQVKINKNIRKLAKDDKEAVAMLLSFSADKGDCAGMLLSGAKFQQAADTICDYLEGR